MAFIKVETKSGLTMRINVNHIVNYFQDFDVDFDGVCIYEDGSRLYTPLESSRKCYTKVKQSPEELDRLIEAATGTLIVSEDNVCELLVLTREDLRQKEEDADWVGWASFKTSTQSKMHLAKEVRFIDNDGTVRYIKQ